MPAIAVVDAHSGARRAAARPVHGHHTTARHARHHVARRERHVLGALRPEVPMPVVRDAVRASLRTEARAAAVVSAEVADAPAACQREHSEQQRSTHA